MHVSPRGETTIIGEGVEGKMNLHSLDALKTGRGLKIASLNVRSLYPKAGQIECILQDESIDVLNCNESWLSPRITNNCLQVENYMIYRWDRLQRNRGGGICLYIHKNLKVDAQMYEQCNKSDNTIEVFVLNVQQKYTKPIVIISVYRPPQGNQTDFVNALREVLKTVMGGNKVIMMGDFNIDYNMKNCKAVRNLKQLENEFNFQQQITEPTRVSINSATLIDHMCVYQYRRCCL